jgi:methylmalonyl-CoA mutase C-terminal domain/subunit
MEVIYTGIRQPPEVIVSTAVQEDVDVVGLSILSGAHLELFPLVIDGLRQAGKGDTLVIAGGIIPEDDVPRVKEMGVAEVVGPGTFTTEIVDSIRKHLGA